MKLNEVFQFKVIIEQKNVASINDAADAKAFLARVEKRPRTITHNAVGVAIEKLEKRLSSREGGDADLEAAIDVLKDWQKKNPLRLRKSPTDFDQEERNRGLRHGSNYNTFDLGPRNNPF